MPKTMLIDATHAEETRVAVVDGNRLVEFDYESKVRKQLKGGIFLAKVTRVEPSLQAAFVNFGGNRHGFLPFSEIHPDYFRIPVADREALLAAQIAELEEHDEEMQQQEAAIEQRAAAQSGDSVEGLEEDEEEEEVIVEVGGEDQPVLDEDDSEEETAEAADAEDDVEEAPAPRRPVAMENRAETIEGPAVEDSEAEESEEDDEEGEEFASHDNQPDHDAEQEEADEQDEQEDAQPVLDAEGNPVVVEGAAEGEGQPRRDRNRGRGRGRDGNRGGRSGGRSRGRNGQGGRGSEDERAVDSLGGDGVEGDRPFRFNFRRSYKIQEVIKRGQIMLIQVSKEERGNKGAAVTTYLSLPGRYCVLMPNSPRGGGVSRKIASFKDRKRMKDMLGDLAVPDGMSVILRTAGVARTKVEIKRDLDYLTRLWNTIREHTLKSSAPAMIYEEGSLIKRAIRDLYSRDIEDVLVSGEEGYKSAKEFMKMLMPSHAKKVQEYKNDLVPMFHKHGVESQIADIGEPVVNLKSGGYLVINPTEALVSVDVNSGRATKERHIEETALKTNLEAADEVARQLRLRDLGGLVVIDFIDMEDRRNNRKVEQRLRDALSTDRARIQVGRISSFGLLELSRQRLNPSLSEAQTEVCQHCMGIGRVRTLDFSAISIIRALEAEGIKGKCTDITLTLGSNVALYILNNKRRQISEIESRYNVVIHVEIDELMSNTHFKLEPSVRAAAPILQEGIKVASHSDDTSYDDVEEDDGEEEGGNDEVSEARPPRQPRQQNNNREDEAVELDSEGRPKRRRGRRGGRGRRNGRENGEGAQLDADGQPVEGNAPLTESGEAPDAPVSETSGEERPRRDRNRGRRGGRDRNERRPRPDADGNVAVPADPSDQPQPSYSEPRPAPVLSAPETVVRQSAAASNDARPLAAPAPREYENVNQAPEKKKKGWWNKLVE